MDRLADRLAHVPIRAVYSSNLKRTLYGARQIAAKHGLEVGIYPELREKHFGNWEGVKLETIKERYPNEWREWLTRPDQAVPSGGENYRNVEQRVIPMIDKILSEYRGKHVVISCHGGVNRVILCRALGLGLEHLFQIEQDFGAVNIIDYSLRNAVVRLMNGKDIH